MPRSIKILEGFNEAMEEWGYELGDAQDFLDRVEPMMYELIADLVQGRVSPADARYKVWEEFRNARAEILDHRNQRTIVGLEYDYRHIDPDSMPLVRIVAQLPKDIA